MCNLKKKKKSTLNVTSVRENDFQKNSFLPPLSLSLFHVDRGSFLFSLCISELSKDRPTSKYAGQRAGRLRQPTDWNRRAATASATSATAIATNASSAGSHAAIQGQSESGGEPANRGTQERKSSASRRFYSEYIYEPNFLLRRHLRHSTDNDVSFVSRASRVETRAFLESSSTTYL